MVATSSSKNAYHMDKSVGSKIFGKSVDLSHWQKSLVNLATIVESLDKFSN